MDVKEKLDKHSFFDGAILRHGFEQYMRDYTIIVEVDGNDHLGGAGRYRYRFTHCMQADYCTSLPDESLRQSWSDHYIHQDAITDDSASFGFVWAVGWAGAYPGLFYLEDSEVAMACSTRLGKAMHEIRIETNVFTLNLVFHDVVIAKLNDQRPILDRVNIPIEP